MSKLLSSLLMAAVVAGLTTVGGAAPAQDKKDVKKDTKVVKGGGTIEVNESKDGKYRFTVRDADGKYVGGSAVGYESKEAAVKAVDALKAALAGGKIEYNKKDDKK